MKKLAIAMAVAIMILAACSDHRHASEYDPALCAQLISAKNSAINLSDITPQQWTDMLTQFQAINIELDRQIQTLLDTPWSAEKEKAINDLDKSLLVKQWHELAYMVAATHHTGMIPPELIPEGYVERMDDLMLKNTRNLMYFNDIDQL